MQPESVKTPAKALSDLEIAQRIAAGDRDVLERLMRQNNQRLYRTARSILKDDAEAEDAVQEAYLLAYQAMAGFRGGSSLSTWLVRIVVNEAIARVRKRGRRAEVIQLEGTTDPEGDHREEDTLASSTEQPEQAVLRAETRRLIEAKIDQLPDVFRTVFMLRAVEELTVEEAAAFMSWIENRCHDCSSDGSLQIMYGLDGRRERTAAARRRRPEEAGRRRPAEAEEHVAAVGAAGSLAPERLEAAAWRARRGETSWHGGAQHGAC